MKESVRDNLLTALLFQNVCGQYLEFTKHETNGDGKAFLNVLINRLKANERDCLHKITTEKGRQLFQKEMTKGDALQYANIFLMMLEMDEEKRNTVEKLVTSIHKGELVEFVEPEKNSKETNLNASMEDERNEGFPEED